MRIKINNEYYEGQFNALSYLFYKKVFKVSIFDDLKELKKILKIFLDKKIYDEYIKEFNYIISKIIYIYIYSVNNKITSFDVLFKNHESLLSEDVNLIINECIENFYDENLENELNKITSKNDEEENIFLEHNFIGNCIKFGLNINDLKILSYVDVLKILLSQINIKKSKSIKKATQKDWDNLANNMR